MGEENKEALQEVILKAIGADPEEVEEIDLRIKWKPAKSKPQPQD